MTQETTNVAVAVFVKAGLVLVPVTVKTLEVAGAAVVVVTVSVEEAAVAGFGLKVPSSETKLGFSFQCPPYFDRFTIFRLAVTRITLNFTTIKVGLCDGRSITNTLTRD